jgi:hypothetical protein
MAALLPTHPAKPDHGSSSPEPLTFALIGISIARRRLPHADFCLRRPRGKAWIGRSIAWAAAFAAIMVLADHGGHEHAARH